MYAHWQLVELQDLANPYPAGVNLPKGLRSLTFGSLFNQSLDGVLLPMHMDTLTMGFCFNQSILA